MRRVGAVVGSLLLGLLLFELTLQLLALAAPLFFDRAWTSRPRDGQTFRILCLGDSHTYGWEVGRDETWPARLEQLLDADGGATRFEVVNLGVPASNSWQMATRLPGYLERYGPDLVIVTTGGNDAGNLAGRAQSDGDPVDPLHRALMHLRTYRMLVLALHQRRLVRAPRPGQPELVLGVPGGGAELRNGDVVDRFRHAVEAGAPLDRDEHARRLRRNLEEIVRVAGEYGVPVVLASYTHSLATQGVANEVMREVPGALFVPQDVADLEPRLRALGPEERERGLFFSDLHPRPPLYRAAAANLRDALYRAGLVPRPAPP
jgi:lysophospholipase L1-like esterase